MTAPDTPTRDREPTRDGGDGTVVQVCTLWARPGQPMGVCVACATVVVADGDGGYVAMWRGARSRPVVVAVAHPSRWVGPSDDDVEEGCELVLRARWEAELEAAGAGVLRLGSDGGGPRFFLGDVGLHAGTPIESPRVSCSAYLVVSAMGEGDCIRWDDRRSIPMSSAAGR